MTYAEEHNETEGRYEVSLNRLNRDQEIVFLPDAVPPLVGAHSPDKVMYGWVRGVLPSPSPHDIYLVRFYHDDLEAFGTYDFQIVAYVDRYARVFSTSVPLAVPPARYPDLEFAAYRSHGASEEGQRGCVRVYGTKGDTLVFAQYRCTEGRYSLYNSWFNFGERGENLSLDEALARTFFALVLRSEKMRRAVPMSGLAAVNSRIRGNDAVRALRRVSRFLATVEEDEALRAPAPARFLFKWIHEAGLSHAWRVAETFGGSGVALSRTEYSGQYCLFMDDDSPLDERTAWKLESALNRYEMMVRELGPHAELSDMAACRKADLRLRRTFPLKVSFDETASNDDQGEWSVRVGIARALEELLTPYRFAASFRVDVEAGVVAYEMLVPDADMMPNSVWTDNDGGGKWSKQAVAFQERAAIEYAQRLGLTLAAIAARQSERIHTVTITAEWFYEAEQEQLAEVMAYDGRDHSHGVHDAAPFVPASPWGIPVDVPQSTTPRGVLQDVIKSEDYQTICEALGSDVRMPGGTSDQRRAALHDPSADHAFSVIIDCNNLRIPGIYKAAVTDPGAYFAGLSRLNEEFAKMEFPLSLLDEPDPFWMITTKKTYADRFDIPDLLPREYGKDSVYALGCETSAGLAINYNAPQRNMAERVAETLGGLSSVSEGIAALREVQASSNDPDVLQACTRLMTQLAQGDLRMGDQNQIVGSFLGEDRFADALRRYRVAKLSDDEQVDELLGELSRLVDETMAAGVFSDDEDMVYRVFDSSTARIFYNLTQSGVLRVRGLTERVILDNGKSVSLAPDSYYHCCVELVRGLEQRFDRSDDALRYGLECVRLAPTVPLGYRQLARAYMLVGDVVHARDLLVTALRFAVGRTEISWLYYQLAYVEWKSGNVFAAQACYLKAIVENPEIIEVAANELRELLGTENTGIMNARDVEPTLQAVGIPLAPTPDVMDALQRASRAAVDEGAFLAARNVLSVQLHHRPDNALVHVLRSLER